MHRNERMNQPQCSSSANVLRADTIHRMRVGKAWKITKVVNAILRVSGGDKYGSAAKE